MSIRENMAIPVLNYNNQYVFAISNITTYSFAPSTENIPTVAYISFPEIVYINSISDCFRTGLLTFADEVKEDVFKELKCTDWQNIITNEEIRNIIKNPTKEGLEKLINITNESIFNRVRYALIELKNSNAYDISSRVIKVIDARWQEIKRGIFKSQIQINFKNATNHTTSDESVELEKMKTLNANLQEQLDNMQKMIEQLMNNKATEDSDIEQENKPKQTKKVGRPTKQK